MFCFVCFVIFWVLTHLSLVKVTFFSLSSPFFLLFFFSPHLYVVFFFNKFQALPI